MYKSLFIINHQLSSIGTEETYMSKIDMSDLSKIIRNEVGDLADDMEIKCVFIKTGLLTHILATNHEPTIEVFHTIEKKCGSTSIFCKSINNIIDSKHETRNYYQSILHTIKGYLSEVIDSYDTSFGAINSIKIIYDRRCSELDESLSDSHKENLTEIFNNK